MWPAPVLLFKTKTYYEDNDKENRKIKGSAIIISNHRSFWDGIVIAFRFFFKRLHYLVADWYGNTRKFLKFVISCAGGIFVDKDLRNFDFIEKTKKVTRKGRAILIFPEGDFKFTPEPADFSTGYILLAIKTKSKIVPVVNDFNYGIFKRVHLMIGKSIDLSQYSDEEITREKLKIINEEIRNKFLNLFHELKERKLKKQNK